MLVYVDYYSIDVDLKSMLLLLIIDLIDYVI